jgi:hypothetical protein
MSVEARVTALEARVEALERTGGPAPVGADSRSGGAGRPSVTHGDRTFWALEGLRERASEPARS